MILTVLMLSPLCREQTKSNPFTTAFVTRTLQRFKLICKAVIWFQQRNSERLNTRVVCSCFMQRRHLKGDAFNNRVRFSQQTNSLHTLSRVTSGCQLSYLWKTVCTQSNFFFWASYCKQSNTARLRSYFESAVCFWKQS